MVKVRKLIFVFIVTFSWLVLYYLSSSYEGVVIWSVVGFLICVVYRKYIYRFVLDQVKEEVTITSCKHRSVSGAVLDQGGAITTAIPVVNTYTDITCEEYPSLVLTRSGHVHYRNGEKAKITFYVLGNKKMTYLF